MAREGRRGGRARRRRRRVDGGAAGALRRPDPGAASRGTSRTSSSILRSASSSRRPTSRRANVNLAPRRPVPGSLALDQNFLWRPFAGSPGTRRRSSALAHRRDDAPGPGPRRRLGHAGREAAAPEAAAAGEALDLADHDRDAVVRGRPRRLPAAGADGIGIWEMKLADDSLERSGERARGPRRRSRKCLRSCRCR